MKTHTTESTENDMRAIWQGVLRECHRSDPERSGQIARNVFIAAIERNTSKRVYFHSLILIFFFLINTYIYFSNILS